MHENKTNKNPETTENSKKQKSQEQTNTEVDLNPAQSKYPIAFCGHMQLDPNMNIIHYIHYCFNMHRKGAWWIVVCHGLGSI